jgi:GTPase
VNDSPDDPYRQALAAVEQTLDRYRRGTDEEKDKLRAEFAGLRSMHDKLLAGRVEIVVFGEISTGKSALINALVGEAVAAVDVRGGWTKEVWHVDWSGAGYVLPGLGKSQVVLIDTPGINEVGGGARGEMAREAAQRADLILFVTDSDLNETEYSNLIELATFHKPILVVLNKVDLYSREQRARLMEVLTNDRLKEIVPADQVVSTAADPREREYVIQRADGSEESQWRRPPPDVGELKARILELLEREGLALTALNAALYAADKTDRIAALRVQLRQTRAMQVIWSYATLKAIAVGLNPFAVADVFSGVAIDAAMIVTLGAVYGLELSWTHARVGHLDRQSGWLDDGECRGDDAGCVGIQSAHGRQGHAAHRTPPRSRGRLWVVHRRPGRAVLLRARLKLGDRRPQGRGAIDPSRDRQGIGDAAA